MTLFQILVLSRWIHFTAVCLLFGASFFWFYMRGLGAVEAAGGLPRTLRGTILLLRIAAPAAALSGVVWLAGILANMAGSFGDVFDPMNLRLFFFETQFGPISIFRLLLLVAAVVIAACPGGSRAWFAALLCVAGFLLINQAWFGHAAEGGAGLYGAVMIATYSVHMLAASAWVGGLPPLLLTLAEQRRFKPYQAREWTFEILSRYSLMAIVAVALVVISGTANAGFRVAGAFDKLF
jgi:putative copper resistance protein D